MHQPQRDQLIEQLYEPAVVRAFAASVSADLVAALRSEERAASQAMVANRQAEFATGRACARSAMAQFGIDGAIPRRDDGSPQWPRGVTGSISHTRGFCVAVASTGHHCVGIDVEEVDRMTTNIERRILVDVERALLDDLDDAARKRRVATIFASKESFYKAHYELEPRYLGFDAVAVTIEDSTVRFAPASGAVDAAVLGRSTGQFRFDAGRVIVGVAIDTAVSGRPLPSSG